MTKALLLGAGAALLLAGAAAAAPQVAKPERGRTADGDGRVSQAEMVQAQRARFARMDADRDGKVTTEELAALKSRRLDDRFARLDADGDGSISKAEFSAAHQARGHHRGGRGGGAGFFAGLDANKDGAVTQAEADAKAQARFAALDKNKDGFVTSDERPSKMGRHGPHGRGGETR